MNKIRQSWWLLSLICVWIGITYLSLKSASHATPIRINDKLGHFIAYAVFSLNALIVWRLKSYRFKTILGLVLVSYGLLMELLQGFVPGREVSGYDLLANSIGVGIGFLLFSRLRKYL
jgi:VanZ family protein